MILIEFLHKKSKLCIWFSNIINNMNFSMLKSMVENLVKWYKCPSCSGKDISEQNIDIVGAAGNTVNIDMHCPNCDKHFMAKTEVMQMELGNISADKLAKIQKSLSALKGKLWWDIELESTILPEKKILDENIVDLKKWMEQKKNFSVNDLLGDL